MHDDLATYLEMGSKTPDPRPLTAAQVLVYAAGNVGAELRVGVASLGPPATTVRWTLRQQGGSGAVLMSWLHALTFEPVRVTCPPNCQLDGTAIAIAAPGGTAVVSAVPVQLPRTQK